MQSLDAAGGPGDRLGVGTDYHRAHEMADLRFRVRDGRSFSHISALERDPVRRAACRCSKGSTPT